MNNLHKRWRIAVMLPMAYAICGCLISRYVFQPGQGLFPVNTTTTLILLFAGAGMTTVLHHLMTVLFVRQRDALSAVGGEASTIAVLLKQSQMNQFLICDLAASPGIIIFIVSGQLFHLFMFLILSLFFYLRCFPTPRVFEARRSKTGSP